MNSPEAYIILGKQPLVQVAPANRRALLEQVLSPVHLVSLTNEPIPFCFHALQNPETKATIFNKHMQC